ncbi:MAG TPA: erythromycin esterase family protein [Casimicrobiaceae bacterium]|nr:erythromycin esterase family protein [Casimicrobiaceae bacterium]
MLETIDSGIIDQVRGAAHLMTGTLADYDPLLDMIGEARVVLLGEASHGTHEFYRERARITERLIRERGFNAVAVEADWPDAYRVNRFVRGASADTSAAEALADFKRFPQWMWRNTDVVAFVGWLRQHNATLAGQRPRTGFYGLDLYSLHTSMQAVERFLERIDPQAAQQARERYGCFDRFGEEPQEYGFLTSISGARSCQAEVISELADLQRRSIEYLKRDGREAEDEAFFAEQNARLVRNAEEYYRAMFYGNVRSWNLRDRHMAEMLDALAAYLTRRDGYARIAVWAHNSHLGDARATEMSRRGELNLGQLVRERYAHDALLVGFTTHHGFVTAASEWGGAAERKSVRAALEGSYEALLHATGLKRFMLRFRREGPTPEALQERKLERAIGVIYLPQTERMSHYFHVELARQFDAVIHFDQTSAVEPLERTARWERGELPETYPSGV